MSRLFTLVCAFWLTGAALAQPLTGPPIMPFQVHLHQGQVLPFDLSLEGVAQGQTSFPLILERDLYVLLLDDGEPRVSWDGRTWGRAQELFTGMLDVGVSQQGGLKVVLRACARPENQP